MTKQSTNVPYTWMNLQLSDIEYVTIPQENETFQIKTPSKVFS